MFHEGNDFENWLALGFVSEIMEKAEFHENIGKGQNTTTFGCVTGFCVFVSLLILFIFH